MDLGPKKVVSVRMGKSLHKKLVDIAKHEKTTVSSIMHGLAVNKVKYHNRKQNRKSK